MQTVNNLNSLLQDKLFNLYDCTLTNIEWLNLIDESLYLPLVDENILKGLTPIEANGHSGLLNLNYGLKRYDFIEENGTLFAHPIDGIEKPIQIENPTDTLKSFSSSRLLEMLVKKNELSVVRKFQNDKVIIATTNIGSKSVAFVFTANSETLNDGQIFKWFSDFSKSFTRIIILSPNPEKAESIFSTINPIKVNQLPSIEEKWIIKPSLFCEPSMDLNLSDVLRFYPNKIVALDTVLKEIYLFGKKIQTSNYQYLYLKSLIENPGREFSQEYFGTEKMKYDKNSDIQGQISEIRTDLRKKVKSLFPDSPTVFDKINKMLFSAGGAKVKSLLDQEEILIWQ